MATITRLVAPPGLQRRRDPLVLWHLLSLDAPTVAALWMWFVARSSGVALPASSVAAMALAVWILYAADRLLDARTLDRPISALCPPDPLEARHLFHHRHRAAFLAGILIAALALGFLLPLLLPAAMRLYGLEGALLLAWFLVLHATPRAASLPKELAVGIFFASAIFIPTVARRPELRLALIPAALLFAALCGLNCIFIHAWEHTANDAPAHATTRFAVRHLHALAVAEVLFALVAALVSHTVRPIAAACGLAALLLLELHRRHDRIGRTTLRAAADLALLTPLLLTPFLR